MPEKDLALQVKRLRPSALRLLKQRLAAATTEDKARFAGIPELSDVVSSQTPISQITQTGQNTPKTTSAGADIPLWKKALNVFNAPFEWVDKNIQDPFAAAVTAPFTPSTGTSVPGESWLAREKREYENWQGPDIMPGSKTFRPVKGAVEFLPWLAPTLLSGGAGALAKGLQGAGAIAKLGTTSKILEGASKLGKATESIGSFSKLNKAGKVIKAGTGFAGVAENFGTAGKVAGTIAKVSPWGLAEAGTNKALSLAGKGVKAAIGKMAPKGIVGKELWQMTREEFNNLPTAYRGVNKGSRTTGNLYITSDKGMASKFSGGKTAGGKVLEGKITDPSKLLPDQEMIEAEGRNLSGREAFDMGQAQIDSNYFETRTYDEIIDQARKEGKLISRTMKQFAPDQPVAESFGPLREARMKGAIEEGAGKVGAITEEALTKIAKDQNIPVDFLKLHQNPARTEGLKAVGKAKGLAYLKEVATYSQDDVLKQRMIRSFSEGDLNDAGMIADGILQTYHMDKAGAGYKQLADLLPETPVKPPVEPPKPPTAPPPAATSTPAAPTIVRKITSEFNPTGFTPAQESSISKITQMIKESKGFRKSTEELYTTQRAERIAKYQSVVKKGQGGVSTNPEQTLGKALKKMGGELEQTPLTPEYETIRNSVSEEDVQNLFGIVLNTAYKDEFHRINTFKAVQELLLNNIPQMNQLALLEKTFGSDLVKSLLGKRTWGQKIGELALDLLNAPRALLSSCDISGLLRQGGVLFAAHPIQAAKTVLPMLRALLSDANEAMVDSLIRTRPHFDVLVKNGLYVAPKVGRVAVMLGEREEAFMSTLINKIPFVKASNRAYVTVLNDLRTRIGEQTLTMWEKAGLKFGEADIKDLTQMINWATGRGTMPKALSRNGAALNTLFFSPKLILSRLELPTTILPSVTKSALVRKEATKTLLTAVGVGAGILTAAKLSGAVDKIELDPRSSNFGKLKVGNTYLDIWTGYAQYIRLAAQLATGQTKTSSGIIQGVNRGTTLGRFGQTKLAPAAGLVMDLLKGETYMGETFPPSTLSAVGKEVYQRLMPLAIQDIIDGIVQDGFAGGIVSSTSFFGTGVATYSDQVKKEQDKVAQATYGMNWDEVGMKYGNAAQLRLTQTTPAIIAAEKKQEKQFSLNPSVMNNWYKEGKSIEDTYREAVKLATAEYRATGDGSNFRTKVSNAQMVRSSMYGMRETKKEYSEIAENYRKPLTPEQKSTMNIGDVLRREYSQQMYSADMYDQYHNYDYSKAAQKEQEFFLKYGQAALDYLEEYQGSSWTDKPAEMVALEKAKDILKPFWKITDDVWAKYPPELKDMADLVSRLEATDPLEAKRLISKNPSILLARKYIAYYKKLYLYQHPDAAQVYRLYYS